MPMLEVNTLAGVLPGAETFENHKGTLTMEVFRVGDYGRKGKYDEAALDQLVTDYSESMSPAPVTIDHTQEGAAYGWVTRLWREGGALWAEMSDVSRHLVEAVRSKRFRTRSIEIIRKLPETGRPYFSAVSFLGAAMPHVRGMADVVFTAGDRDMDENGDDVPHAFRFSSNLPTDLWVEASDESSLNDLPADTDGDNPTNSQDTIQMSDTNAADKPLEKEAPAASVETTENDARFAEAEENKRLRAELETLKSQFAQAEIGREVERFGAHFDTLVENDKALPAERDHALAIFAAIQTRSDKVTFGAGDEAKDVDLADAFRAMFDSRPADIFSHLSNDVASPAPGADAIDRVDSAGKDGTVFNASSPLLARARALMSENPNLTISDALIAASKSNKTEGTAYVEATHRD